MLNFSQQPELALHAAVIREVAAVAASMEIELLIVGAFARDLHLHYAHKVPVQRQTEDLDLALAVPDWDAFDQLKQRLVATKQFIALKEAHRIRHQSMPIDLVPFGAVEGADRHIAWPPQGDVVMDVFGFQEAMRTAIRVALPGGVEARVVSLPALALLKLVCWKDRHLVSPRKDAADLQLIVTNYLNAGNQDRLWSEFSAWVREDEFDSELAGPRMLGVDIKALLSESDCGRVAALLATQLEMLGSYPLPYEMNSHNPERAHELIAAIHAGLTESDKKK